MSEDEKDKVVKKVKPLPKLTKKHNHPKYVTKLYLKADKNNILVRKKKK